MLNNDNIYTSILNNDIYNSVLDNLNKIIINNSTKNNKVIIKVKTRYKDTEYQNIEDNPCIKDSTISFIEYHQYGFHFCIEFYSTKYSDIVVSSWGDTFKICTNFINKNLINYENPNSIQSEELLFQLTSVMNNQDIKFYEIIKIIINKFKKQYHECDTNN